MIYLVNPQFSNNDVVYCRGHFLPGVVIVAFVKHALDGAWRDTRESTLKKEVIHVTPSLVWLLLRPKGTHPKE